MNYPRIEYMYGICHGASAIISRESIVKLSPRLLRARIVIDEAGKSLVCGLLFMQNADASVIEISVTDI